jgi:hypothetical protein
MQRRKSILISTITLLILCSLVMSVYAVNTEGSLASGYAVTSNYHGKDVPSGASVTVTAMTTASSVDKVTFIWKNPAGQVVFTETKHVWTNGTRYDGKLIRYAQSTFEPNAMGDWGVQVKFLDVHSFCIWTWTETVARRATSFNVIPEIPILGTMGASIAMVAGLTYKTKRNKKGKQA